MRDKGTVKELWLIGGLLVLSIALLFGLYGEGPSKGVDLVTKIAFAVLVAAVTRLLWLGFGALEKPGDPESFRDLGMLRVKEALSDTELKKRLRRAHEIRVLKTWFPESSEIRQGLEEAIRRNAHLTLYLLQPESPMLKVRSLGADQVEDLGKNRVEEALFYLEKRAAEHPAACVRVALYDSWPGCPIIQVDDRYLLGFYFRAAPSPDWPWIEIEKTSPLGTILDGQFKSIEQQVLEDRWLTPSRPYSETGSATGGSP